MLESSPLRCPSSDQNDARCAHAPHEQSNRVSPSQESVRVIVREDLGVK